MLNLSVAVAGDWVADVPVIERSHGHSNAVGASPSGTRTLSAVGMRVFKVVAPKIAVRSHFTLDSPKVGALVAGDTIVVTESRWASINPVADGGDDGDASGAAGGTVERLHCLGGWVSATSTSSGDELVEEEEGAADKQLVSGMQQLESRLRPIKAKQGQIDSFVERQEKRAEMSKSRLEQGRREAEDRELIEVRAAQEKARKKAVASGVDGAGEVSESLLKHTKAFEAALLVRERRKEEEAAVVEAAAARDEARSQRLSSLQSSPRAAAAAEAAVEEMDSPVTAPEPQPPLAMPNKQARKELFQRIDVNGNGGLSLAEIDKAVVEGVIGAALHCPDFDHKPALIRAVKAADASGDDFIQRAEFAKLLSYLVYFNNLWHKFEEIDSDGDRRLDLPEFAQGCATLGLELSESEAAAEFAVVDRDGGGMVLFEEFCTWSASWSGGHLAFEGPA